MFYKLPERYPENRRGYKHHEQVLPRIIGSSDVRNAASTYIYRAPFKEKMALTKMLNDWSQADIDMTKETNEIIRPKAATVIKDWLNNAKDSDAHVAENFLSYLRKDKNRAKTALSPRTNQIKPTENEKGPDDAGTGVKKRRREWQPHSKIMYESFYPDEGCGNHTGVFNLVRNGSKPHPLAPLKPTREKTAPSLRQRAPVVYYPPPINRSSMFEMVQLPTDGYYQSKQPRIERKHFGEFAGDSTKAVDGGENGRSTSLSSPLSARSDSTKLQFSANMHAEENGLEKSQENTQHNGYIAESKISQETRIYPKHQRSKSAGAYLRHLDSHFFMELRRPAPENTNDMLR